MTGLKISPDLTLPLEAVTETFAILAVKRAGKSNAAVVMAEEMYDAGVPWVAIDPKGDWWGIRAAGDGQTPGLAVLVFGGLHGDVPLEPTAGRLVADLVAEQRITCVLDVSEMTKADQRRFLTDFADRLYRRNTEPLHVFCEEADEYIPQRVLGEAAKLVGAFETLVKRGGFRGIGVTLITQRSASLNKDVLTQAGTLIAMRTPSPQDRKAVLAWIDYHAESKDVIDELPTLEAGQAWVFSPQWLRMLVKIQFRRRRTFDSGATPKVGGKPRPPATLAEVDLAAIKEQMAETIDKAAAEDPKALRRRIAELERALAAERVKKPEPTIEYVDVLDPATAADLRGLIPAIADGLDAALEPLQTRLSTISARLKDLDRTQNSQKAGNAGRPGTPSSARRASTSSSSPGREPGAGSVATREHPSPAREMRPGSGEGLSPARRKLLEALVALESIGVDHAPRNQVALLAGVSPKSSGYANNLGAMNTAGLIHYPTKGYVAITPEGRAHVDQAPAIATTQELHDRVREIISPARWRIIEPLLDAYPDPLTRDDLADAAGVSAASSGYANNLGALRSFGLLDYPGAGLVIAADVLFLGGTR